MADCTLDKAWDAAFFFGCYSKPDWNSYLDLSPFTSYNVISRITTFEIFTLTTMKDQACRMVQELYGRLYGRL
uniref:Uncharacterized protein n=1 Tax=Romanomermis culicivorax TaxID=13658 RepID=A0A915L7C0_ROMCU